MKIEGLVYKKAYRDEKTGFGGFFVKTERELVFCKGVTQPLIVNMPISIEGNYQIDNKGRESFVIESYELLTSNSNFEVAFLSNLEIDGLNLKIAKEFVDYFNSVFDVIKDIKRAKIFEERCPKNLKSFARPVYLKVRRILTEYELFNIVMQAGGTYSNVSLISAKYGKNAINSLKNDPYMVGYLCDVKFSVVEVLALNNNISYVDKRRATGLLNYAMNMAVENGDCYITTETLKKNVYYLQKNSIIGQTPYEFVLSIAILNDNYIVEGDRIYRKYMRNNLKSIALNVNRLIRSGRTFVLDTQIIDSLEKSLKIELSQSQKNACLNALKKEGIKILTGGPGSGKTTLTNLIIKYCETKMPGEEICLCAPTGCAAQNLALKTGRVAETIHKILGIQPYTGDKLRVTKKLTAKVYIVDEVSMLDAELAAILFNAIPSRSLVFLVGDVDQLPSVSAGNVLQDLIDAGIETYRLEGTFRQQNGSGIISNAYKINNGDCNLDESCADFSVWHVATEKDAVELCTSFAGDGTDGWQILCPTRKFSCGSVEISRLVQGKRSMSGACKKYGGTTYYIGDKVIALNNNYEMGYFNGELGVVTDIDDDGIEIIFSNNKKIYIKNAFLVELALSYAISIHKSQGTEHEHIIVLLTEKASGMMTRNLLYTAVTRARKTVDIIVQGNMLKKAITTTGKKRLSGLAEYIKQEAA